MGTVLLMRLAGPLQSWGTQSRFSDRDTGLEPSKSGVIGLLCAALGRPRHAPVDDLAALDMAVRVDREGVLLRDYHTVGGGRVPAWALDQAGVRTYGVSKASGASPDTVVSRRYYLADARFLVALAGPRELIEHLAAALENPRWPLFLGRKACVPSEPVLVGLRDVASAADALRAEPWRPADNSDREPPPGKLRLVITVGLDEGQPRNDVPLCFVKGDRRFDVRRIRVEFIPTPLGEVTHA